MSDEQTTTANTNTNLSLNFDAPEEEATVTVLHGYGRVAPTDKHWVDGTLFIGGVARHVPLSVARKFKSVPRMGQAMHVLADDAGEAEFARASGIQPMATPKFAAMLNAIDLDKLADELGPVRAREIAELLLAKSESKTTRGSDGKWRSKRQSVNEG